MKRDPGRLYHRADCTANPDNLEDYTGREGDRLRGCRECGRFVVLALTAEAGTKPGEVLSMLETPGPLRPILPPECYRPDAEPTAPPLEVRSPYRCRDHHARPVDRNGRGCPDCQQERRPKRAKTERAIEYDAPNAFTRLEEHQ